MQRSLELIDQLIKMEEERDKVWKAVQAKLHKSSQTVGESSMLFHLKALKELVEKESKEAALTYSHPTFTASVGCIGRAYCPTCKSWKTGTCLCAMICPDCSKNMTSFETDKVPEPISVSLYPSWTSMGTGSFDGVVAGFSIPTFPIGT